MVTRTATSVPAGASGSTLPAMALPSTVTTFTPCWTAAALSTVMWYTAPRKRRVTVKLPSVWGMQGSTFRPSSVGWMPRMYWLTLKKVHAAVPVSQLFFVLTDESTEDMQKMAAILPDDDATTYFGTSVWTHAKQRIPWLLILMLSATFTGMVTTHYEEAFVSLPLLVSFMPMLMDTAGNCGNQISTLMVRGLALGEVEPSDFMRVLGKELRVSAIVGAVLGLVNGLRIYLMYTFLFPGQYANVMGYAVVVSVSLFFSVILAKLVGGMLPLAAKKLGADPAIMATPFITTIVDACSLILYFQIAQLVFRNMM